MLNSKLA
jgi:hypothetical protein